MFGDRDVIYDVTAVEKLKIHGWGTSIFSENTVTSFVLTFLTLTFHANFLGLWRQFAWNVKVSFLGKYRKY